MRTQNGTRTIARAGTTLIELLVVVGIVVVISLTTALVLNGRRSRTELDAVTQQASALLRDAQNRAVSQASSTPWGVRISNESTTVPFMALFASSTYATNTQLGAYRFPTRVSIATTSIAAGSSTDIIFGLGTGDPAAATSIIFALRSDPTISTTLSISTSGQVSY